MATYNGATVNGMSLFCWSEADRALEKKVLARLDVLRPVALAEIAKREGAGQGYITTSRFTDNFEIAFRVVSAQLPLLANPVTVTDKNLDNYIDNYIVAALIDTAESDHYYAHEKDWGN